MRWSSSPLAAERRSNTGRPRGRLAITCPLRGQSPRRSGSGSHERRRTGHSRFAALFRPTAINVPYTGQTNDAGMLAWNREADYFLQMIKDQFDTLYQEGAAGTQERVTRRAIAVDWRLEI